MDGGQLMLSHWRQWDVQTWLPVCGEDRAIPPRALETEVVRLIEESEAMLGASADTATRTGDIVLEFVLPSDMLTFPVQHLKKKALAGETVPLAIDHPVVIRSLDRLRVPRCHLAWRHQWALAEKQVRPYWSQPSGADYFERLAAALLSDPHVFCLILSEPPAPTNHTAHLEITAALRAGIPAIVWHRQDCGPEDFRDDVTTIVSDGALAQLPRHVADQRLDALRLASAIPDHPGWKIALLYDDPNRLLKPPRRTGRGQGSSSPVVQSTAAPWSETMRRGLTARESEPSRVTRGTPKESRECEHTNPGDLQQLFRIISRNAEDSETVGIAAHLVPFPTDTATVDHGGSAPKSLHLITDPVEVIYRQLQTAAHEQRLPDDDGLTSGGIRPWTNQ